MSPLYFDESGIHPQSKFFGFGILEVKNPNKVKRELRNVLDKWHFSEEIKFWKISKLRANIYQEWIDTYFQTEAHFHVLIIEKKKDRKLQYIHERLIQWFEHVLTKSKERVVYADVESPLETEVVQSLFRKNNIPLDQLTFVDSKSNLLIQLSDLLLGATRASFEKEVTSENKLKIMKLVEKGVKKNKISIQKI